MTDAPKAQAWQHSRKGYIEGLVVSDRGVWLDILLTEPVSGITVSWEPGEILTARRSFLTEVPVR